MKAFNSGTNQIESVAFDLELASYFGFDSDVIE